MIALLLATLLLPPPAPRAGDKTDKDKDGYVAIFDGKTLKGWTVSAKTGHSGTSKNKSGGRWVAEEGAITGSQDVPGNGGQSCRSVHTHASVPRTSRLQLRRGQDAHGRGVVVQRPVVFVKDVSLFRGESDREGMARGASGSGWQ